MNRSTVAIIAVSTLLLGSGTSGMLFVAPMPRVERRLLDLDDRLSVRKVAAGSPRWVDELLEAAYVGVYPLIPIALGVHLLFAAAPDAGHFWSVILVTDYVCFGALPWLQTRPPRGIELEREHRPQRGRRPRDETVLQIGERPVGRLAHDVEVERGEVDPRRGPRRDPLERDRLVVQPGPQHPQPIHELAEAHLPGPPSASTSPSRPRTPIFR